MSATIDDIFNGENSDLSADASASENKSTTIVFVNNDELSQHAPREPEEIKPQKYPRSLDELLNMSSDSDEGSEGGIDLEKLLLVSDDDDDNSTPLAPSPVSAIEDNEQLKVVSSAEDWILADQRNIGEMSISFTYCPALQEADKREQKWVHQGANLNTSFLEERQVTLTPTIILEESPTISLLLQRNGAYIQHGPGTASSICVCSKYTAIGTTKGNVLIFDKRDEIRRVLSVPEGNKSKLAMEVTSLDCLFDGSVLVTGHKSGDLILWDCDKGQLLKQIPNPYAGTTNAISEDSEIVHVYFLSNVSTADMSVNHSLSDSESFHLVTLTNGNNINRYKVSKSRSAKWKVEIDCLIDGSLGQIFALEALRPQRRMRESIPNPSPKHLKVNSSFLDIPGVDWSDMYHELTHYPAMTQYYAFSIQRQTMIVQVAPSIKVIHKWNYENPNNVKHGRECLDWTYLYLTTEESSTIKPGKVSGVWTPVLTRARVNKIETLAMRTLHYRQHKDYSSRPGAPLPELQHVFQAVDTRLLPYDGDDIMAIKWLDRVRPMRLVVLTTLECYVLDSSLAIMEVAVLSDPLMQAYKVSIPGTSIEPRLVCDDKELLALVSMSLQRLKVQSPFEQVDSFIQSGRWLEGLKVVVQRVKECPALGISEQVAIHRYLTQYVTLGIARKSDYRQSSNLVSLIASICIEYCLNIDSLSFLFDSIYNMFQTDGYHVIFLEMLEPYIVSHTIKSLPTHVIHELFTLVESRKVEYHPLVERYMANLDARTMDMDVIKLLYDHEMYSAFLYVYSTVLNDYPGAIQIVIQQVVKKFYRFSEEGDVLILSDSNCLEAHPIIYKILLFVLYTVQDRRFPCGENAENPTIENILSIFEGLINGKFKTLSLPWLPTTDDETSEQDWKSTQTFPYLTFLADIDASALFIVIFKGIERLLHALGKADTFVVKAEKGLTPMPLNFKIVNILNNILTFSYQNDSKTESLYFQHIDRLMRSHVESPYHVFPILALPLSTEVIIGLLQYTSKQPLTQYKFYEKELHRLVDKQCYLHVSDEIYLTLLRDNLNKYRFYLTALSVCGDVVTDIELFNEALQFYIDLAHSLSPTLHKQEERQDGWDLVFDFITKWFEKLLLDKHDRFLLKLMQRIVELIEIDMTKTVQTIVMPYCIGDSVEDTSWLLREILFVHYAENSQGQYKLLKEVFEQLKVNSGVDRQRLLLYMRLLAKYNPDEVLSFMMKYKANCPLDECRTIAEEFQLIDVIAYLQQMSGDIIGALNTLLTGFATTIKTVPEEIDVQLKLQTHSAPSFLASALIKSIANNKNGKMDHDLISLLIEFSNCGKAKRLFDYMLSICEDSQGNEEQQRFLWYKVFDHLWKARSKLLESVLYSLCN